MTRGDNDEAAEAAVLPIRKIDNSVGLILPKKLLARLRLKEGDVLHIVEEVDRTLTLSPYSPKHAKAMEIARRASRDYADTFKALAK